MTARKRILDHLAANPSGSSKADLRRVANCSRPQFRRLVQSLVDTKQITVEEVEDKECGTKRIHKLVAGARETGYQG